MPAPKDADPLSPAHPFPRGHAVAVVDDDIQICEALAEWLSLLDLPCRTYGSAEALLADLMVSGGRFWLRDGAVPAAPLAAAIVDMNLPGMHGTSLVQYLQSVLSPLRVVVITATNDDERKRLEAAAPGVEFVRKPFALDRLEDALFGKPACSTP